VVAAISCQAEVSLCGTQRREPKMGDPRMETRFECCQFTSNSDRPMAGVKLSRVTPVQL